MTEATESPQSLPLGGRLPGECSPPGAPAGYLEAGLEETPRDHRSAHIRMLLRQNPPPEPRGIMVSFLLYYESPSATKREKEGAAARMLEYLKAWGKAPP